ncbi:acetylxylan esterase [Paenibacillus tarimensis]
MDFIAKKLDELHRYRAESTAPGDLDAFWERTLSASNGQPFNESRAKADYSSPYMDVYRVTYNGCDETRIHGWFVLPNFVNRREGGLPCVVIYHGYRGGKGHPEMYANWLLHGFAVFAMDVRGQGGETGNALGQQFGMTGGWITQGLLDPERSYYRAIAADAVRALQWTARQPEINPKEIYAVGGSQGGGLALLTGALCDIPRKVIADVPNMCHMDYGIYHSQGSLSEAASFVSKFPDRLDTVLHTLSYFDMLNLVDRLQVPVMVTVSLKDPVCLPETIFAVYNRITGPKRLHVYPFNGHSTGEGHFQKQVQFILGGE